MSGAKFSLMSRASLASMASRLLGADPAGDPPAQSGEGAGTTTEEADKPEGEGTTTEQSDAGTTTEQSETETASDDAGAVEQPASDAAGSQAVVSAEDAAAVAAEQHRAGRLAENRRTADVFASAEGQANPMQAAWLLANGPDATAESIVKSLATFPGAKPGAAAGGQVIADTNIDLGRGNPQAALDAGGNTPDADDAWDESSKRVGAMSGATLARSDGGAFVTAGAPLGNKPGALRPTGN